ncbi:MAG: TatD family hydrolase [Patescibacteria group bacterium]
MAKTKTGMRAVVAVALLGAAVAFAIAVIVINLAIKLGKFKQMAVKQAERADLVGKGPAGLFDMHAHWQPTVTSETMLQNMDESNVMTAVIMPNGGRAFDEARDLVLRYPKRFVACLGFQNKEWIQQRPEFLEQIESKLQTGEFKCLGEVLLRHFAIEERGVHDIDIPANSLTTLKVLELASKYNVSVIIHLDHEERTSRGKSTLDELAELLGSARDQGWRPPVILGHAAGPTSGVNPEVLASLLDSYDNLYLDISSRTLVARGSKALLIVDNGGVLLPGWRKFLIKYQDRIFVGSDIPFPEWWNKPKSPFSYKNLMRSQINVLNQLPRDAAEKIGHKNALKLFGVE